MTKQQCLVPRRRAASDIRLLRLELLPHGKTPFDEIGYEWSAAQPTENLSPEKAAKDLAVEVWAPQSVVKKRYRTLQLRYPPEQFPERHTELRPSSELLINARARLNWYWQSGLVPFITSELAASNAFIWDEGSAEPEKSVSIVLDSLINSLGD